MAQLPSVCIVLPHIYAVLAGRPQLRRVGGAELRHSIVARQLAARGYRVSVVCLDEGQAEDETIDGVRIVKTHTPTGGLPFVRFVHPRLTAVWRALKKADADIYYQPCAGALTGIVGQFCRLHHRKAVFAGAHDSDFTRAEQVGIRNFRDRWLFRRGIERVHAITAQTAHQRRLCQQNFDRDAVVIPNPYEPPYDPEDSRRDYVLWVARIDRWKRPDRYLAMARRLPQVRFRMIGGPASGSAAAHRYYESIEAEAGSVPNIEFLGFLPYEEAERQFDDAAAFVITSESEGFPNTLLQAWARGIPSISFFHPELLEEDVYRKVETVDEAAAVLSELLEGGPEYQRLSAQCKRYHRQYYSVDRVIPEYERLFLNLMQ